MELKELKESTAAALLESIKKSAEVQTRADHLEQLARAYALVVEATPEDKTNVVYS